MQLQDYWTIVKRWWWLMVACVLVASVSSYIGTLGMPRIYQATATVMIGQSIQEANPSSSDIWVSQQLAATYSQMVKRQPILQGAAQALGLNFIPSGANVSTRSIESTQLLEISVRDTDPLRAKALADEICNQLVLQSPTNSRDQARQDFVQAQLSDLEAKVKATEAEVEAEQAKLDAANSARAIQQYQSNISALQTKLNTYRSSYASLLLTVQGGTNFITIFETANVPSYPISPNVSQTVLLAAAIGLGLAVAGAFLIEFLDDTIKTPDELARLAPVPVLGSIAPIEGENPSDRLVVANEPLSTISEAFRVMRTNIQFAFVDRRLRSFAVTSAGPSEGKSITLANLATSIAQSGAKVVAIDGDLRRPTQHKIFGVSNEDGLCDLILHPEHRAEDYLKQTAVENLWLLTTGPLPPNPAELLGSQRMGDIIEELQEFADLLVFDTPPALVVTDAVVVSTRVDGVIVVVDAGHTRRGLIKRVVDELHRVRANVLGFALNRVKIHSGGYYYQYYYYYNEDGARQSRRNSKRSPFSLPSLSRNGNGNGGNGKSAGAKPASAPVSAPASAPAGEGETTAGAID
ncbi:MAG: polysaccharide biosynthesis tyrosine autokinase [Anaerolineae bacterium]|nr:polysaccharide biosynthesis tyrosine autokinase [Anaerolineae bacterium]